MRRAHNPRPLVTLLLRIVPHYRVSFLNRLAERLHVAGIDLQVLFGQERPGTEPRSVRIDSPWARCVRNVYGQLGSLEWVWQPAIREVSGSDLIVVEQANRLLANYVLQFQRRREGFQLAYWGHGRNMQHRHTSSLTERLKRRLIGEVDWWFAYTDISKQQVASAGFPLEQITVLNNTVDDEELADAVHGLRHETQASLARELGCRSANVAVFMGTLHKDKRLDFLLRACASIREQVPDFELLIVGTGPEQALVAAAARQTPGIRYLGPVHGAARARYLRAAKMLLMPGLVGLVIVDSFVAECPLITTSYPFHSPEIAYLDSGSNGMLVDDDVVAYASCVVTLLRDDRQLAQLRRGCAESAQRYALRSMVDNFADGVQRCLARPPAAGARVATVNAL